MEIIYQCDAQIVGTAKSAAIEFARSYWAEPRKIVKWNAEAGTFEMKGGSGRVYRIRLDAGERFSRPAAFQVVVA